MNRINLLKPRASQTVVDASPLDVSSPGFILRGREVVLGVGLLALAVGALYWQFGRSGEPEVFAEDTGAATDPGVLVVDMEPSAPPTPEPAPPDTEAGYNPAGEPPLIGTAEVVTDPPPAAAPDPAPPRPATASPAETQPDDLDGDVPLGCETPCAIRALNAAATDDRVLITITSAGRPDAGAFRVDNPSRVVVDFPGTNMALPDGEQALRVDLAGALARNLRIAQNSLNPPKVRLVIEVSEFPDTQITPSAEGLNILLTREQ